MRLNSEMTGLMSLLVTSQQIESVNYCDEGLRQGRLRTTI